jgi:hypothetical protein
MDSMSFLAATFLYENAGDGGGSKRPVIMQRIYAPAGDRQPHFDNY